MHPAEPFEQERREIEAVLASASFSRAPSLAQLLTYICNRYFAGDADQIKEYNIAVEALFRPPGFDQKRDSIVRVEAYRLRKRLREYYAGEGASHPVHIVVPSGQYVPRFVPRELALSRNGDSDSPLSAEEAAAAALPPEAAVGALTQAYPGSAFRLPRIAVAAILLIAGAAAVLLVLNRMDQVTNAAFLPVAKPAVSSPGLTEVRLLAGWSQRDYMDRQGRLWGADRYFKGGTSFALPGHHIARTRDLEMYQSRREGDFQYDIPLAPGVYELRLHFAETVFGEQNIAGGGEASRIFNVYANGAAVLEGFDVIADAGANTADIRALRNISPAPDGFLHLRFAHVNGGAFLNALEITPGIAGRLRPIRFAARDRAYTAKNGVVWETDRYYTGGQLVSRHDPVSGTLDPELYQGERFGNIVYTIPVPPGRYGVTLKFAETWFGPNKPDTGGPGKRLFDILCNGAALKRDFDIFKEAGGSDRALDRTFHQQQPNAQGKLVISLVPVKNYACVNAIEVVDESP